AGSVGFCQPVAHGIKSIGSVVGCSRIIGTGEAVLGVIGEGHIGADVQAAVRLLVVHLGLVHLAVGIEDRLADVPQRVGDPIGAAQAVMGVGDGAARGGPSGDGLDQVEAVGVEGVVGDAPPPKIGIFFLLARPSIVDPRRVIPKTALFDPKNIDLTLKNGHIFGLNPRQLRI
ncbi:MAG: hypothetical protein SVV67_11300, partial [Bacillota bacterium]|nr:hypothetical protein [Bacillota bacterium]